MTIGHLTIIYNKETKECQFSTADLGLLDLVELSRHLVNKVTDALLASAQIVPATNGQKPEEVPVDSHSS
jgi:hypothetical protein